MAFIGEDFAPQFGPTHAGSKSCRWCRQKSPTTAARCCGPHRSLSFCHLESPALGPQPSDAAVAHLSQLKRLAGLKLVGRGFTVDSSSHLQRRRLREPSLCNANVTPAVIAAMKKSQPWPRICGHLLRRRGISFRASTAPAHAVAPFKLPVRRPAVNSSPRTRPVNLRGRESSRDSAATAPAR